VSQYRSTATGQLGQCKAASLQRLSRKKGQGNEQIGQRAGKIASPISNNK